MLFYLLFIHLKLSVLPRPTIAVLVILWPSFKPVLRGLFESKQALLKLSHRGKN